MRVASFNMENLGTPHGKGVPVEARIAILRPQLERLAADVLCLQEINADKATRSGERELNALNQLVEGTTYETYHRAHTTDPETDRLADKHNMVIMSRWPIQTSEQVWHSMVPPISYTPTTAVPQSEAPLHVTWDRPLLYCAIDVPGAETLHVLNLHLRAPLAAPVAGQKSGPYDWRSTSGWAEGYYMAMLKRSGQALEARLLIDRIFDATPDALILVCGDFNAEEREVPARIISATTDDTGNGALAGRSLIFVERSVPESQRFSVIHHGQKLMLDHVLMSHALSACYRHVEIHNESITDELFGFANIGENPESYHAPVVAEFDL